MSKLDELEFKRWLQRVSENSGEKIASSAIFMSIFSESFKQQPQCALELGMAIMLDKPVLLLVPKGTAVPENMRLLARGLEEFELGDEASMKAAMQRLTEKAKPWLEGSGDG